MRRVQQLGCRRRGILKQPLRIQPLGTPEPPRSRAARAKDQSIERRCVASARAGWICQRRARRWRRRRRAWRTRALEFRRSPHALSACRHILEHSSITEACFQAAATLRDSALRDWAALPPEQRSGLRQFYLRLVLAKAGGY